MFSGIMLWTISTTSTTIVSKYRDKHDIYRYEPCLRSTHRITCSMSLRTCKMNLKLTGSLRNLKLIVSKTSRHRLLEKSGGNELNTLLIRLAPNDGTKNNSINVNAYPHWKSSNWAAHQHKKDHKSKTLSRSSDCGRVWPSYGSWYKNWPFLWAE